jgi:hypothetical protein
MASIEPFPKLSEEMDDFCLRSTNEFTRLTPNWIARCFELDGAMPDKYGWRMSDVASIQRQIAGLKDYREINRVFWEDQARNVEAYATMTFWRGSEILRGSIRSLNVGEVVTPAILVRSLIELASTYLLNANTIEKFFSDIQFPPNTRVVSAEFEERVVKMIWGTRLGEPETYVKQTNVLTIIQKLAKSPKVAELLPKYEFLCEVAHPNVIGNSRYWSHIERENPDGSNSATMSRHARGDHANEILEATMWGLGWSAGSLRNSFTLVRNGLAQLLGKLPKA